MTTTPRGLASDKVDSRPPLWTAVVYGLLAVAFFQFGLGLYACALNELFYAKFGPFYDSMSYLNILANYQANAAVKGRFTALLDASFRSNVVYPWLVFALFVTAPIARSNGIWIQVSAAAAMQFMLFLYFFRIRLLPLVQAIVFSAVFCLIAAMFGFNGGLSDFRMDLLQYLLMTTVMVSYLIARESRSIAWWLLLGFLVGILCLARATSPVYLVPIFAVLVCVELVLDAGNWRRILGRWAVAGATAILVAGWHFVANYDRLHYYYFIWNADANARLSLASSQAHVSFLVRHIGKGLLVVLAAVAGVTVMFAWRQQGLRALKMLNWRALIFSAVPIGYLILSGAGLNPFVSIVASGGIVLFLLDPLAGPRARFGLAAGVVLIAALGAACATNAYRGIANHSRDDKVNPYIPHRVGLAKVLAEMTDTVRRRGADRVYTFAVTHNGSISASSLENTLVYDRGFKPTGTGILAHGEVSLRRVEPRLSSPTAVNWRELPGQTDDEKITLAIARMVAEVDFAIVAAEGSDLPAHVFATRFVPKIRAELLHSGLWVQKEGPIEISRTERILLLFNSKRLGPS